MTVSSPAHERAISRSWSVARRGLGRASRPERPRPLHLSKSVDPRRSAGAVREERLDRYWTDVGILETPRDIGGDADDPRHHRDGALDRLRGRTSFHVARDRCDAACDMNPEPCRVEPNDPQKDLLADRIGELVIRANERTDEVSPRDDPDELLAVDDHEPVDELPGHQPSGLGERLVRPNGDRRTRHRFARRRRLELLFAGLRRLLVTEQSSEAVRSKDLCARLLEQEIALGDDTDGAADVIDDRQAADATLDQYLRHFLERRGPLDRDHRRGHHVADRHHRTYHPSSSKPIRSRRSAMVAGRRDGPRMRWSRRRRAAGSGTAPRVSCAPEGSRRTRIGVRGPP